jgi:hypothetical protein
VLSLFRNLDRKFIVLGLMSAITFQIGVVFIPIEFFSICYLIFAMGKPFKVENTHLQYFLKSIMVAGLLLILTQLFTDSYLGISRFETAKSMAQIFTVVSLIFAGITLLAQSAQRLHSFLMGYVLSSLLTFFFFTNLYIDTDPWKFLFANSTSMLVFLLLGKLKRIRSVQFLIILTLTFTHFILGARSSALLTLLTVISIIIPHRILSSRRSFVMIILSIFLISSGTEQIYQRLALNGTLGVTQQIKAKQQFESGPLILVARSEILYEIGSIKESFIFGKGSNPNLSQSLLFSVSLAQERLGLQTKKNAAYEQYIKTGKIPQHSMLFSSWVENGLIGLLFWLIIVIFLFRNFRLVVSSDNNFTFLTSYLLVSALWSLFFSPLGAGSRLFIALAVTCVARFVILESEVEGTRD